MNDDVRSTIYGTIALFLLVVASWLSLIYISSCGFTLTCNRAAPRVERTPIPTLIPASHSEPEMGEGVVEFNKCKVAATDLIGAWAMAGHPGTEPFPFTDLDGQSCEGIFAEDIQPLFVENSLWFPGSLGCISCHNAELSDRSRGLDLSSYEAISLGTRRVQGATSPGTDLFGRGEWENSILHEVLVNQGLTAEGHSPDAPTNQVFVYAGQRVVAAEVPPTPSATTTREATSTAEATATPTP